MDAQTDASIQVFSPHLYNRARNQLIQVEGLCQLTEHEEALTASLMTIHGNEGEIPNIATKYNESIYDMFLLGNTDYEKDCRYGYKAQVELNGGREMTFLPLAVYTSRLNPRIRSQSGMFLVYNLYAEPSSEGEYKYLELENIQNYYLKRCKGKNKKQFLYTIKISAKGIKDIAGCFAALGLSKERIYPELANVRDRLK